MPTLALLAHRQSGTLKAPAAAMPRLSLIALLGSSITPMLLFLSYNFIASGTATVFHFVYPALVVGGGVLFLKEKLHHLTLLSIICCVVGIVLATGSVMVLENCFLPEGVPGWNLRNLLITALLVAAMPCWKAVTKKKLSSIGLILLSAVLGILVYGI